MGTDPGDIPLTSGGRNLVRVLSEARVLPVVAIRGAVRSPGRIRAQVIAAIEAVSAGVPPDATDENLIFWGIHALAEARDTTLFRPLSRLLRLPGDDLESLLGDALTSTLPRVVASVYDGDVDGLEAAIIDREIDEFARWSLMQAMTFLTIEGRIDRARTTALLQRFESENHARAGEAVWAGWEEAIALLGFAEMAGRVEAARQDGRLLDDLNGRDWFEETLADAVARPLDRSRFDAGSFGYVQDAAVELDGMLASSDAQIEPERPIENPLRDLGRNDPCPCGSGRKFKKCCLGKPSDRLST